MLMSLNDPPSPDRIGLMTHNVCVYSALNCGLIKLHHRVTKFMYSNILSDYDTVRLMTPFFLSTEASFLPENFRYIMYTFKIPMFACY